MMFPFAIVREWDLGELIIPFCVICFLIFFGRTLINVLDIHPLVVSLVCCLAVRIWTTVKKRISPAKCQLKKTPRQDTKKEEPPAVSENPKKKQVKEKRKRKKSSDKEIKGIEILDSKVQCRKSKMFAINLYHEVTVGLKLRPYDLYWEFNYYTLSRDQLADCNFPLELPGKPGHVASNCKKFAKDPTLRICSRCHETFRIIDGGYHATSTCYYHPVRCNVGYYNCCQTQYGSKGCKECKYHVYSEPDLDNVLFRRTDGKRIVRKDQSRRVYALDCEMVFTTMGMEVAKVGLVDMEGKTVYQTFVLPEYPILDYNTEFSGITRDSFKDVSVTLADVQSFMLRTLTKDTILVGHALQNDLRVLRLIHEKVVDTQVVFHEGNYLRKLKALTQEYLKKTIQNNKEGHDSIEDAQACMELMLWKIKSDIETMGRVVVEEDTSTHNIANFTESDFLNRPITDRALPDYVKYDEHAMNLEYCEPYSSFRCFPPGTEYWRRTIPNFT